MSNKRSNNYNLVTTITNSDAIHAINDGNAQSILDVCSKDTKYSNDQESVAQSSTDMQHHVLGKNIRLICRIGRTLFYRMLKFKIHNLARKYLDSSIALGECCDSKGVVGVVGRDSVQNCRCASSEKIQKSTFMKCHRYFRLLQTDILSTNTFVDVGNHVNILCSKAELEKILGRPLQKMSLSLSNMTVYR